MAEFRLGEGRAWRERGGAWLGVVLLLGGGLSGQNPAGPRAKALFPGLLRGAWGARESLARWGFRLEPVWTNEIFWNLRGGQKTRHARVERQDASLYGWWDSEGARAWKGGTFFFHLQAERGRSLTPEYVGDYQVLSNMAAPDFRQVSEVWFEQSFLGGGFRVKAGKQENSADFGYSEYAQEFLNSSAAVLPHVPLDTFPNPDLGAALFFSFSRAFSARAGCFQSRPRGGRSPAAAFRELHGPLLLGEQVFRYGPEGGGGSLHAGGWWRNDETPPVGRATGRRETYDHSYGGYFFWDQQVWRGGGEGGPGPLGFFFQFTWAPENLDEVARYVGGGLEWTGPLPGRGADVAGLGFFQVRFSGKTGFERHSETAIELFYRYQASSWGAVKPDVQYILSPGGRSRPGALVLGFRFEVRF